jgi:hypothetical protein
VLRVTSAVCDAGTASLALSKIKRMRMRLSCTAAAVLLALHAAAAWADRDPQSGAPLPPKKHENSSPITDHFAASVSYFPSKLNTTLRADPTVGPAGVQGTTMNAEQALGLPDSLHKGTVEFMFRLGQRNKVRMAYLEQDRSGDQVLTNDIVFANSVFLAGLPASSSLDYKQFNITYTYSFIRTERFEVGTGLAVYFLQVDGNMTQAQPFTIALHEEVSGASPFPALPFDLTWCFSSRWSATAHGAFLKATISGTQGWYADEHADIQYRWNPNLVVGAGYSETRTSLSNDSSSSFRGYLNISIKGPQAFLRFSF